MAPPRPTAWRRLRGAVRLLRLVLQLGRMVLEMALGYAKLPEPERQRRQQGWSLSLMRSLGVRLELQGQAQAEPGLIVSNHVSWLDILAINAACPKAKFVSKADVLAWPVLGWLIRGVGTLFIERERKRDALRVVHHMAEALGQGRTIAIFPEGTTGTGPQMLPFHANLLQAAISVAVPIQPVALRYREAGLAFSTSAPYVGDTSLVQSLWWVACAEQLVVQASLLAPLATLGSERRPLAEQLSQKIQQQLDAG